MGSRETEKVSASAAYTQEARNFGAQGRWHDALAPARKAAIHAPASPDAALYLGVLLSKLGSLHEAEAELRRGLALAPESPPLRMSLGHVLLAQGKYQEGWPLERAREQIPALSRNLPRTLPFPRWRGEPLTGKRLAIFPEQGLGDQIQLVRFLPPLVASARGITLLTRGALARLFRANFPQVEIVVADGAVNFTDPDYWATLQDLPMLLGVEADTIPSHPYLVSTVPGPALGKGFKVGLKTTGNPSHVNDGMRSLSEACAARLQTGLPGMVISLDPEESEAVDMADTAALIDQLDLIVSVDTSVAHLAGAMGKPCLLLVPGFAPDWRWMWNRSDSPWYPNHRLYRGGADGDWTEAVEQLLKDAANAAAPTRIHAREAIALRDQGRFSEALAAGRKAVAADPRNLIALHNLARLLTDLGRLEEGEEVQRRALAVQPDAPALRFGLAMNLLSQGRYHEAWPYYEARTRLPHLNAGFPQGVHFPRWAGENIADKRIAILPEQGFGDQIQFARLLAWLKGRCREIILLVPPALVTFFHQAFPGLTIVAAVGQASFPKCDVWTTLNDLPALADLRSDALPDGDYARRPSKAVGAFRIGLMTKGNPAYLHDIHRSLPASAVAALRDRLPGVIVDLDPAMSGARSFADTATIMDGVDLVVSVDTAVGHLAGAIGKPCLLLIPGFATDWRWGTAGAESGWYPQHRLFRATVDGDWQTAINAVVAAAQQAAIARPAPERLAPHSEQSRTLTRAGNRLLAEKPLEALPLYRSAVEVDPHNLAAVRNLGTLLTHMGELAEAETWQRKVVERLPSDEGAVHGLAHNLMAQGRYAEGWPMLDIRTGLGLNLDYPTDVGKPHWAGEDLAGKCIAILPEQGLGDYLQFVRFLPRLIARGAKVVLMTPSPLLRLFHHSFPEVEVLDARASALPATVDYWTTCVEFPRWLGVTLETIPGTLYLKTPVRLPPRTTDFAVGLMVAGNPKHTNDARRSLDDATAATLRQKLPGTLVSLDPRQSGARDMADTAALIEQLDLVVTVDTSVGHLAGALGKRCFLLVPGLRTDWRWLRDRDDSPWYPQHRLFRSTLQGDWGAAIDALAVQAHALADARTRAAALP